jgi:hypothetical protein
MLPRFYIDSLESTLNAGATWRAKGPNRIPPDVATAFKTFTKELQAMLGRQSSTDTPAVKKASDEFRMAYEKYNVCWCN